MDGARPEPDHRARGCSERGTGGGAGSGGAGATSAPAVTSAPASTSAATTATPVTASPTTTSSPGPAARASTGCGQEPALTGTDRTPPGDVPSAITVGLQQRTYRLGVPSSYDKDTPAPVILSLHGAGGTAERQSIYTAMPTRAAARGFLTVTPDAVDGSWELPGEGADDQFLTALLDDVADRYCVDLDRRARGRPVAGGLEGGDHRLHAPRPVRLDRAGDGRSAPVRVRADAGRRVPWDGRPHRPLRRGRRPWCRRHRAQRRPAGRLGEHAGVGEGRRLLGPEGRR